jgi:hypothetical protein
MRSIVAALALIVLSVSLSACSDGGKSFTPGTTNATNGVLKHPQGGWPFT